MTDAERIARSVAEIIRSGDGPPAARDIESQITATLDAIASHHGIPAISFS